MEETLKLKNSEKKDYHYEEAIKTLRTNLQFCSSSMKVIMFTSSLPDEGKSEITFCLILWVYRQEGAFGGWGYPEIRPCKEVRD